MHVASLGEGVAAERGLPASGTSPAHLGQHRPQSGAGTFGPRGWFAAVPATMIDFATPVTRQPCRAAGGAPRPAGRIPVDPFRWKMHLADRLMPVCKSLAAQCIGSTKHPGVDEASRTDKTA